MTKVAVSIVVSVLVLAAALSIAVPGTATTTRPALRLLDLRPLTVRGLHFQPSERVSVLAMLEGMKLRRQARADASGLFTASFRDAPPHDPCGSGLLVVAVGSLGSKTLLKLPPRECAPLRAPP
jgi:hypothetical protein